MSFYDFTVEEYSEFLKKELAGTNIIPMGIMTPGKRGRKPKQIEHNIQTTDMAVADSSPIFGQSG